MNNQMLQRPTLQHPRGLIIGICKSDIGEGQLLDGGKTYKLHLPPNVPAKLHWSITLYDKMARSILDNGTRAARIPSFTGPIANADGSYDLYFGPKPIAGQERNFVRTIPGKGWFLLLRLYEPQEAYFDGSWRPDDVVEVDRRELTTSVSRGGDG